jgi:uncharacterized protein
MLHAQLIAKTLQVQTRQVEAVVELLDGGNTIPFISRYRKEHTGSLDEEQIRLISVDIERMRALDNRRESVLASIAEQGKLTDELKAQIMRADNLTALEDLYQPYRPKRKTLASIARDRGLQGLADKILQQAHTRETPQEMARSFLNEHVTNIEDALAGARHIAAEVISDHTQVRQQTRDRASQWGLLRAEKSANAEDPKQVYQVYYEFEFRVDRLRPHQVLAINRGEEEKVLRVKVDVAERDWHTSIGAHFRPDPRSPWCEQLKLSIEDAAERLLLPAIERDIRRALTEKAERHAIQVFADNMRALLSQPPLAGHTVLGIDPGFRTGCKLAVVDPTGKVLDSGTMYPHEPQKRRAEALAELSNLIKKYGVTLISIGNGTASRESEQLAAELIKELPGVRYLITNEAGASVYSASPLARAELPGMDVSLRGAVSIARRVQDPLAELVKIDPKSIGVGLYQHDVNQAELARTLDGVIESVVNRVGVDVNTASPALLAHVSGIGPKIAERIVAYRDEHGPYQQRKELMKVSGLGAKAFEQAAGFLRVREGAEPLDASAIHPESYTAARTIMQLAQISMRDGIEAKRAGLNKLTAHTPVKTLAEQLQTGEPTVQDIIEQLVRPGRDPRQDLPAPILRSDVLSMEDLTPGLSIKGTVRNVVDFGSFVDIGVKQDGLLHRSQVPAGTRLQVGEVIQVQIISVDAQRGRISLGWAQPS